jgi:DNA processing protein
MHALHRDIVRRGAACAEYPHGTPLRRGLFVRRNRIVSGLARGIVVVEASATSGALGTARAARRQGRFVAAVPGDVTRETSLGTLALLRSGATAVAHAGQVLELVEEASGRGAPSRPGGPADHPQVIEAEGEAPALLGALAGRAATADTLARRLGWEAGRTRATLARLELAGAVRRIAGGRFVRPGASLR